MKNGTTPRRRRTPATTTGGAAPGRRRARSRTARRGSRRCRIYRGRYLNPCQSTLQLDRGVAACVAEPICPDVPGDPRAMLPEWAASFGEARWYLSPGTVPLFNQLDKYVTLRPSMRPAHRTPSVRDGREANVRSQGRSARADPARGYNKPRFDPSPSRAACGVAATYFVGAAAFLAGA